MAETLPPDFDADAYGAAYPDVALSGLSPRLHYLRFGRLLGRSPSGKAASPSTLKRGRENPIAPQPEDEGKVANGSAKVASQMSVNIIDTPESFNSRNVIPSKAPANVRPSQSGPFTLQELAKTPALDELCGPLVAYARMFSLPFDRELGPREAGESICSDHLRLGATRIENAWLAEPTLLRMMVGRTADTAAGGWSLRAYQALPDDPAHLLSPGGIQLPPHGPAFVDFRMVHEMMPLLFELTETEGQLRGFALLPFPSLLPHGLHWGELKTLQADASPMDAVWSLSRQFLDALLQEKEPSTALASVAAGDLHRSVADWLRVVCGVTVEQAPNVRNEGATPIIEALPPSGELRLILPYKAVPTLAVVTSRHLHLNGAAQASGHHIVAEANSHRPRWSVTLPPASIPLHLAIIHAEARPSEAAKPASVPTKTADQSSPTIILLDASQPHDAEAIIGTLKEAMAGTACDLLVRLPEQESGVGAALDELWGQGSWEQLPATADLPAIARSSRHARVLTISAQVRTTGETLNSLFRLLVDHPAAASVSCLLLQEAVIKKKVVLRPGFGGLFPSGASLISGPRLAFAEPDVSLALAGQTYPVVANRFDLTVWRRDLLENVVSTPSFGTRDIEDLRVGLELTLAGCSNLCTTLLQASLGGQSMRREMIDPFGPAHVSPADWAGILERVTVLQELF